MLYPNIAAERARRNMSLTDLAAVLGVNRRTVWRWEKQGKIPQQAVEKMADLFNVSAAYLLEVKNDG